MVPLQHGGGRVFHCLGTTAKVKLPLAVSLVLWISAIEGAANKTFSQGLQNEVNHIEAI